MAPAIKLAIIGFGKMGQRHWQKLQNNRNFEIVAIVDSKEPAESLPCDILFFNDYREVKLGMAEAVLIACPSSLHGQVGLHYLTAGFHVFMEKPLALEFADCEALVGAADKSGVVLMVGMVERFNPAFVACCDLLRRCGVNVKCLDFERFNPTSAISDSDVILDLLIHDLDLLVLLVGDLELLDIQVKDFRFGKFGYDFVDIGLRFFGGVEARLKVGRGDDVGKARRICVGEWDGGCFEVDFMGRELVGFEDGGVRYDGLLGGDALDGEHGRFLELIKNEGKNTNELKVMDLLFRIREELDSCRL